jgi:predicted ester cyclase
MSESGHKALFKQFVDEIFHRGDLAAVDRFFTSDARIVDPGVEMRGPKGLIPALRGLLTAFPDLRITVEDQIEEGDRLAVRYRGEGTHRVAWRGIPAHGTRIRYTGILIVRFDHGRIAEYWAQPDLLGLLQQLDAVRIVEQPEAVASSSNGA